ncbi:hypothetical protein HDE_06966 [Halotydeus destructor]|nr:hypothetical protein HDE_06966 [Halotydeus destructor]
MFVETGNDFTFVFVMAVQRVMQNLMPQAIVNFRTQIKEMYGNTFRDMGQIFDKLVDNNDYSVLAVTDGTNGQITPIMPASFQGRGKIVRVGRKSNKFGNLKETVRVDNEPLAVLDSTGLTIFSQSLRWFEKPGTDLRATKGLQKRIV